MQHQQRRLRVLASFFFLCIVLISPVHAAEPKPSSAASYCRSSVPTLTSAESLIQAIENNLPMATVSGPLVIDSVVTLRGDSSLSLYSENNADHPGSNHIVIQNGGQLTIDLPRASFLANGTTEPLIIVEDGGQLILTGGFLALVAVNPSYPVVEVQTGGKCLIYSNVSLGGADDFGLLPSYVQGDGEIKISNMSPPVLPDRSVPLDPVPDGAAPIPFAEVVQVAPKNMLHIFIALPSFSPNLRSFDITRLDNDGKWVAAQTYTLQKSGQFLSQDGQLSTWSVYHLPLSFIHYQQPWTDAGSIQLCVLLNYDTYTEPTSIITIPLPESGAKTEFFGTQYYGDGPAEFPVPAHFSCRQPTAAPSRPEAGADPVETDQPSFPSETSLPTPTTLPELPCCTFFPSRPVEKTPFIFSGFSTALSTTFMLILIGAAIGLFHKRH